MNNNPQLCDMNAADGEYWESQWCDTCYRNKWNCAIYRDSMGGEPKNAKRIVRKDGKIICTKYICKKSYQPKRKNPKDQATIFDFSD